jgi:hypothetical protein
MNETIITGEEIICDLLNYNNIEEYNSVRIWYGQSEIQISDLKIVFYEEK